MFKNSSLTWWQMGILKLSLLSIGVAIGSQWAEIFLPYAAWLAGVGIVLGLYIAFAWFRK